ncbi:peptidase S8 [Macellibacteroides sp. HH-ZS]|nr:peptidase S8 [Macellibacteroides sp. HH-ZS]
MLKTIQKILFLGVIGLLLSGTASGNHSYRFRVYLKDKGNTGYSIDRPEEFLSKEALERRAQRKVAVTSFDIPISESYIDSLSSTGAEPVAQSKWMSTVVMNSPDSLVVDKLKALSFVDSVKWVWKGEVDYPVNIQPDTAKFYPSELPVANYYGQADAQISMLNGVKLHQAGFRGQGMRIAVIDAGFQNVNRISVFDSLRLLGTKNIVSPGQSVYESDDHGTKVLSCMAANSPGVMVGTAPDASYWLIKSEDNRSEFPVEEDYWVAAVEFADSVGVDVITSSLGYFMFDTEDSVYSQCSLDGKTALISKAASMAADKGILLFSSAGNEGASSWGKITFPGDADEIVTVGAVTDDRKKSTFSSIGFTADYRVKPDVVALGSGCSVVDSSGNITYANGTSFSTPILAGMAVCLWQAVPNLTPKEMIETLQRAGHISNHPDAELGYGLPDLYKAYKSQSKHVSER